ncbi:MAG: mammalian cell entry protein [Mycobacteriaceae bacterium]|jgi:Mce-associated membrane protein
MSPLRRLTPADRETAFRVPDPEPRRRTLAVVAAAAGVAVVLSVTVAALIFTKHESVHRAQIRDADVLAFVKSFVTNYTSPDPFHANDYANSVLAQGTGKFAKAFDESIDGIVIQVAQAERGFGAVQEIGIERWNDDASVDVIAVAMMTTKMPDGKPIESPSRWVVTATKEGEQWKVSDLKQVI